MSTALLLTAACQQPVAANGDLLTTTGVSLTYTVTLLPNLVGRDLRTARDAARTAGFSSLTSHDALGRGRFQIVDQNWKVCTQSPGQGIMLTTTRIDFGVVKLAETCPAAEQAG